MYVHELPGWPRLHWDRERLADLLASVRHRQGRLIGHMGAPGFSLRREAVVETLAADVIKTSEIEGERLDREQVRSSIAGRLGMDVGALESADRNVEGIVEMMLDATSHFEQPLTVARLFSWHASLFPAGRCGRSAWRRRHRPHAGGLRPRRQRARLDREIGTFLDWFNSGTDIDPLWKAGLAHLWFVTIHPFDDGNPRIARAIADLVLARSEQSSQRFYSMSSQFRQERAAYYKLLVRNPQGGRSTSYMLVRRD